MADDAKPGRRNRKPVSVALDELGGAPDGGMAIVTADGTTVHRTSPRVAASLRYFLAKAGRRGGDGLPERLAITAALRGEGVTYTTRSVASVLAYDSPATVAIIDLNWTSAPREGGSKKGKGRGRSARNGDGKSGGTGGQSTTTIEPDTPGLRQVDDLLEPLLDDTHGDGDAVDAVDAADAADAADTVDGATTAKPSARRASPRSARSAGTRSGATRGGGGGGGKGDDAPAAIRWESPDGRAATLIDAVEQRASIDDILVPTMNPRLTLVNGGELPIARRPAVAASEELEAVIDQVAKRFDHIILDLPPVLASSDAIRLAHFADAYALVVRHGVTTTHQIESALDELSGVDPLGVILNRYATRIPMFLRRLVGV